MKRNICRGLATLLVLCMVVAACPITAFAQTLMVRSIEVKPITLIENYDGYYDSEYDWETDEYWEYYRYTPEYSMEYTVTWTNGTTTSGEGSNVEYQGEDYWFEWEDAQSYANQWKVGGTYSGTVSLMGVSTEATVTIVKAPVQSIEIAPITLIEKYDGYYDSDYDWETDEYLEYYRYYPSDHMTYTITWTNGTKTSGEGAYVEYQGEFYWFEWEDTQSYANQWKVGGTYSGTVSLMGVSTEATVTIVKAPVQSIEIAPITLIEGIGGYIDNDYNPDTDDYDLEYYRYSPSDHLTYTITWADGTTTSGEDDYVVYQGEQYRLNVYDDQSYETRWLLGNTYTITVSLMGVEVEAPVTIAPSPIDYFEVLRRPSKTEYEVGEFINTDGLKFRVHYTDGSHEDIELDEEDAYPPVELTKFGLEIDVETDVWMAERGMTEYVLSIHDEEFIVPITVANREVKAIRIADDRTTLRLTVDYDDGSQQIYHVLGKMATAYYTRGQERVYYGPLVTTTNQQFGAVIHKRIDTGEMYLEWGMEGNGVCSNTLDHCVWQDLQAMAAGATAGLAIEKARSLTYDGRVTAGNIDVLLEILYKATFVLMDDDVVISSNWEKVVMRADRVSEAFEAFYGVTPDVTMSRDYNPANHTLEIPGEDGHSAEHSHLFAIQEVSDGYTVDVHWYNPEAKQTLVFNRNLQLMAIRSGENRQLGDINGDGQINMRDAFALYKAASGSEVLTDAQKTAADMNGDGAYNMRDAFALYKIASGG